MSDMVFFEIDHFTIIINDILEIISHIIAKSLV